MASTDAATTAVEDYTIGTKCLTEFLGTTIGIYLGCSVVANALLPGAKGQSMGFGWIALGYGLAFYFPGVFFGHISANLNPAMCLADLITGSLNVQEFFALSAAEMVGAFAGGVLVWLHWLPHFKTVPEPPAANAADNLLRKRDALPKQAVEISSYNPRPTGPAAAAAAKEQQQQLGGAGATSLRRRRRAGSGVLGASVSGSLHTSQPFQRMSTQANGTGTMAGDHDGASSMGGDGELDALRKPAKMVQHATKKVKRGIVGTLKEWLTDFMYYAVQHDEYGKPDNWKKPAGGTGASATMGTGRRSGSAAQHLSSDLGADAAGSPRGQRYHGVLHDDGDVSAGRGRGPLSPVLEDEETGTASGSHGGQGRGRLNGATSFRPAAGGDGFGVDDDDWSPGDDRVTRSVLTRTYQQETLEAQVKLLAPALFYTSAALTAAPAAAAALAPSTQPSAQLQSPFFAPASTDDASAAVGDLATGETGKPDKHDDLHLPSPPVTGADKPPALQVPVEGAAAGHAPIIASPFDGMSHQPFAGQEDEPLTGPLAAVLGAGANAAATGAVAPPMKLPTSTSGRLKPSLTQHDLAVAGINGLAAAAAGGAGDAPGGEVVAAATAVAYNALDEEKRRVMALYEAAVIADQNAKLSVFTTRPAIYAPPFNWLTEFLATIMLVLGIKLMAAQMSRQGLSGEVLQPLYVGLFIICQVVGLGGPTGFSVNPARDLGPRIAHALLPIPNKGPSEWYYGWIPVTASLAGGAAGAGLYLAIHSAIW